MQRMRSNFRYGLFAGTCAVAFLAVTMANARASSPQANIGCQRDSALSLAEMAEKPGPIVFHTIPKDLVVDTREVDFYSGGSVEASSLPLGSPRYESAEFVSEGTALCRVRDLKGYWWLVIEDESVSEHPLAYILESQVRTRPAGRSVADGSRAPQQSPADATVSVQGQWA